MHTATRLAVPVIDRVRALNPSARICAYGLYAPLNAALAARARRRRVLGGEFEEDLADVATSVGDDDGRPQPPAITPSSADPRTAVPSSRACVPRPRSRRPAAARRYATLQMPATTADGRLHRGEPRLQAPVPPLPDRAGLRRAVPRSCRPTSCSPTSRRRSRPAPQHITFGDPDFFNGIRARRCGSSRCMSREFPGVTYDVTIKVEHLLKHATCCRGCATPAARSSRARSNRSTTTCSRGSTKGTRARTSIESSTLCRDAGLTLAPTFVAVHAVDDARRRTATCSDDRRARSRRARRARSSSRSGCSFRRGRGCWSCQTSARSRGPFDPATLTYPWAHRRSGSGPVCRPTSPNSSVSGCRPRGSEVFARVWARLHHDAGAGAPPPARSAPRRRAPRSRT